MNLNQLEINKEIREELELYKDTIIHLKHKIVAEKQRNQINHSMLGKLRHRLRVLQQNYCDLYLLNYEI